MMQPFDEVVDTHAATVLRVCASLLGPGPDAEDAWAETFLAALRAHPLEPEVPLEAWLVRVARNKSVDILRRRRREHAVEAQDLAALLYEAHSDPEFDDEVWADVSVLTQRQQFVVLHRFVAQWRYPEIAEKLLCTPAAARRTGSDAIAALRRQRHSRKEGQR